GFPYGHDVRSCSPSSRAPDRTAAPSPAPVLALSPHRTPPLASPPPPLPSPPLPMPIKAAAPLPPRIRDYEVWGRIGGGGMSDVFLARHEVLSVPVVIKTLRTEVGEDASTRLARLLNEARLSARI